MSTPARIEIRDKAFWRILPDGTAEQITVGGWLATALDKAERARVKREDGRG